MSQFASSTSASDAAAAATAAAAVTHAGNDTSKSDVPETLIYYHSCFQDHNMGTEHVERPARTRVISNVLRSKVADQGRAGWRTPRRATDEELMRFHTPEYLREMHGIFDLAESTGKPQEIDGDTTAMKHTREAALRGAGAVCQAVEEVVDGRAKVSPLRMSESCCVLLRAGL
jgi:acetoin utilization deacetylase AcuC-like enzyme